MSSVKVNYYWMVAVMDIVIDIAWYLVLLVVTGYWRLHCLATWSLVVNVTGMVVNSVHSRPRWTLLRMSWNKGYRGLDM